MNHPEQQQPPPGFETDLQPPAAHGEATYRGAGRVTGKVALITGARFAVTGGKPLI